MPLQKPMTAKEWEIVGLIDIIFLLIVFGVVIAVFVGTTSEEQVPTTVPPFPYLTLAIEPAPDITQGSENDHMLLRVLNAPFETRDTISFQPNSSLAAMSMEEFATTPAGRYIDSCLTEYAYHVEEGREGLPGKIRVRAHPDTKMRIINYIFEACSQRYPYIENVSLVAYGTGEEGQI
ncbi:MAG TPA: hypothetical protein PLF13_11495 [candidate division Zixibacteria bacterium]|nr:hypothetical protein [candidate division Zixibacteria bacterium]